MTKWPTKYGICGLPLALRLVFKRLLPPWETIFGILLHVILDHSQYRVWGLVGHEDDWRECTRQLGNVEELVDRILDSELEDIYSGLIYELRYRKSRLIKTARSTGVVSSPKVLLISHLG